MIASTAMAGKAIQIFVGALLFALLFIWVGAVRLKDTLADRTRGSFAAGVIIGSASITLGIFVIIYFLKLLLTDPTP